jgi:hypothetical protein
MITHEARPVAWAQLVAAESGILTGMTWSVAHLKKGQRAAESYFGASVPTGTGCVQATSPFDSRIFARTYPSSPRNV